MSVGYKGKKPLKPLSKGMGLYQVMYWPKLAPDPKKPWAIVNLQTGDVNGRWHPSKEEAQQQARALYANLGDKAKVHGEVHNAYFMFADPATLIAEDGPKWVEAIAPKTYKTPAYGDVEVTSSKIDNFVHSVNAFVRGQDVAINYEHGQDPSKGHKAAGWIKQARKNGNGNLELLIDFTETAKSEVKKKEWRYFSLEWEDMWEHPDGIIFQDVVMGGALTNRPVAKGLMPINFSEIFTENDPKFQFESKEWEHSEPGTGPTPRIGNPTQPDPGTGQYVPRAQGDPSKEELDIAGGWRRESPPIVNEFSEIKEFSEQDALAYLASAVKAMNSYIDNEPDYYDKACANDLISSIYRMQACVAADATDGTDTADGYSLVGMAEEAFTELKKMEAFTTAKSATTKPEPKDDGVNIKFSEAEAVGYLESAKGGLRRIHTNKGDHLIEKIERLLDTPTATRSFNELQALVTDVRTYFRSNGSEKDSTRKFSNGNEGGNTVGELTDRDVRELRNVLEVEDDGEIVEAVKKRFGELAALRDSVSASEQERIFAEQYPAFYAEHRRLMERDRKNGAHNFSEGVSRVKKAEGLGLKTTKMGLSTKAQEMIEDAHVKFSENQGTIEDFENVVKTIMHGGLVQFGEVGTSTDEEIQEFDSTSATGVANARKLFGEVVEKLQRENPEMEYMEVVNLAGKKHPDLAEAYRVTLPA